MTAICGRVGEGSPQSLRRDCGITLRKLVSFGKQSPQIECFDGAAFGITMWATTPQDRSSRRPLSKGDRWLFVADARLDNRGDLERSLGLPHQKLPDSVILFEALLRWSETALDRVIGDFAFALFDAESRSLLLARDPTGQRPLFYAVGKEFTAFASMASALAGAPGISAELNPDSLARAMSDIPPAEDSSYFRAIRRVRPGHVIRVTGHHIQARDYWNPSPGYTQRADARDFVEEYRSVLDESVAPRLRRIGGPVAVQLSSGLDSSAVLSSAAGLSQRERLIAMTSAPVDSLSIVSPRGRFPDESALAAEIAEFLGIRHIIMRDTSSAIGHFRDHARLYQEPFRNNMNGGWISKLSHLAREEGCQVMLTGDVGNLTLNGGSISVLGDLIRSEGLRTWFQEAWLATQGGGARWTGVLMNSFRNYLPATVTSVLERRFLPSIARAEANYLQPNVVERFIRPALPPPHERRTSDSYADGLKVLRSYDFGNYNKGMLAECGIDMRHPLLDRRAIEFSLTVPPHELFRGGRSRSLARRALAGRIPAKILTMSERGYQAADWYKRVCRADMFGMVEEIEKSSAARELLDLPRIRTTIERWDQINFNDPAQNLAIDTYLSLALAGGLFIVEAERSFSG